jgi:hypothetical protein
MGMDNTEALNDLTVNNGVTQIPEGYAWCCECDALTPYNKGKWSSLICIVCNNITYSSMNCPNCHAETPGDITFQQTVVLHHEGCHCQSFDFKRQDDTEFTVFDWSKDIAIKFKEDYLKPYPERGCYCLPRDNDWYHPHMALMQKWQGAYKTECGCPRVIIYRNPQIHNYQDRYVYSADCSNAMEWSYDVRCPICGYTYHESDGNC